MSLFIEVLICASINAIDWKVIRWWSVFVKLASNLSSIGIPQTMPLLFEFIVFYLCVCVCDCTAFDLVEIVTAVPDAMEPIVHSYHIFPV